MNTPSFWKTDLAAIEAAWQNAEKAAEKRILCRSAGGRPVYMLAYGEKKRTGTANYSSALGALDKGCYAPRGQKPCVILIGAEHGQETEGTAALMDLVSLLETGCDLRGQRDDALLAAVRFVKGVGAVLGALFGGSAANDYIKKRNSLGSSFFSALLSFKST